MVTTSVAPTGSQRRKYTKADWADFAHTGPDTLAGRYMRRFWQPVHRADDLPRGRAVPVRIMGEDLTLYRGEVAPHPIRIPSSTEGEGLQGSPSRLLEQRGGTPHLLAFRCAHRGTQLSIGWVEGDNIRCRYHGWVYDASGQCVEQPGELRPFCDKVRIRSYPTQEYLGHIFAYLGDNDPPPLPEFPELAEGDRLLDLPEPRLSPCNYFQRLENEPDEIHLLYAHRHGKPYSNPTSDEIPLIRAEETSYGLVQYGHRASGVRKTNFLMPNVRYTSNHPRYPQERGPRRRLMWRVPSDDEHYWTFNVLSVDVPPEDADRYWKHKAELQRRQSSFDPERALRSIIAGEMQIEDIEYDPDIVGGLEDDVVQLGQGIIADRGQEHLAPSDVGVVLLRKIWVRELRALAEGRPLKRWERSEPLTTTEYGAGGARIKQQEG